MKMVINPQYQQLQDRIRQLPVVFEQEGKPLYRGRNEVRLFDWEGQQVVVKCFKRHNLLKRIIYTFFRKSKARRAFENACQLRARGFQTPEEIAYMELYGAGTVTQVFYLCAYTAAQPIRPRLIEQEPFDRPLATAYARYVASLHEAGVLHRDLNPTNVLYTEEQGQYRFELIDINRMQFFDTSVPKPECMENLTLFWWLSDVYRYVLDVYASCRRWDENDVATAIQVKQQHDKAWVRRKRITHPFRHQQ